MAVQSMKAVLCRRFGPLENLDWADVPAPVAGETQVRIRTTVATVGYMDMLMVRGLYQHKPPLPFVPGAVCAGVVAETGARVTSVRPGERVTASDYGGAFAQERVVGEDDVLSIPEDLDDTQAAAARLSFTPSYLALVTRARLQAGETLVVTGATGGIGFAAMQLGRHFGARVIGAVGSAQKAAFLRAQGFEETVDYSREDFKDRVNALTGGRGADVIFEVVGGPILEQSLRCIDTGGRILVLGFAGGEIPRLPANLPLLKNASIIGSFLGGWRKRRPEEGKAINRAVQRLIAQSGLKTPIARTLPMSQAAEALRMLLAREAIGVIRLLP